MKSPLWRTRPCPWCTAPWLSQHILPGAQHRHLQTTLDFIIQILFLIRFFRFIQISTRTCHRKAMSFFFFLKKRKERNKENNKNHKQKQGQSFPAAESKITLMRSEQINKRQSKTHDSECACTALQSAALIEARWKYSPWPSSGHTEEAVHVH